MKKTILLLAGAALMLALPATAQQLRITPFVGASRSYIPMIEQVEEYHAPASGDAPEAWHHTHTREDYSNQFGLKGGLAAEYAFSERLSLLSETSLQQVGYTRMVIREYSRTYDPQGVPALYDLRGANTETRTLNVNQMLGLGIALTPKLQLQAGLQGTYLAQAKQSGGSYDGEPDQHSIMPGSGAEGLNRFFASAQAGIRFSPIDPLSISLQYQRGLTGMHTETNRYAGNARYQGASLVLGYTLGKR